MKLAAMEGLYEGRKRPPLSPWASSTPARNQAMTYPPSIRRSKIPGLLSLLANRDPNSFVPGINDLVFGNAERNIVGAEQMVTGKIAMADLAATILPKKSGDEAEAAVRPGHFRPIQGRSRLRLPEQPGRGRAAGGHHLLQLSYHGGSRHPVPADLPAGSLLRLQGHPGVPALADLACFFSFFLGYVANQAGWVVAEVGRQPWAIQGLLPVGVASTNIAAGNVQTTFFMFLTLFTACCWRRFALW